MARKKTYPNAWEWVQAAALGDTYAPALSAVHVSRNGKRIEATNRYAIHVVELGKRILPNGLYRLNGEFEEFEKLAKDTTYPELGQYDFVAERPYVELPADAEEYFVAYLRAAEAYVRSRLPRTQDWHGGVTPYVVEFQGHAFDPRRLILAIAGLLLPMNRYGMQAEALRLQTDSRGVISLSRKIGTETRMASIMGSRIVKYSKFAQAFTLDQFFHDAGSSID